MFSNILTPCRPPPPRPTESALAPPEASRHDAYHRQSRRRPSRRAFGRIRGAYVRFLLPRQNEIEDPVERDRAETAILLPLPMAVGLLPLAWITHARFGLTPGRARLGRMLRDGAGRASPSALRGVDLE